MYRVIKIVVLNLQRCKRVFPSDPRSTQIYEHTKEIHVRNAITEASQTNSLFTGFVHDRPLYTGNCDCTHRR